MSSNIEEEYYKLQWDRISHHEDHRIRFSGLVTAGSLAALGIVARFRPDLKVHDLIIVCTVIALVNILAIIFSHKSRSWVEYHQDKSKKLLEKIDSNFSEFVNSIKIEKPESSNDWFRRALIHTYLHSIIVLASAALVVSALVPLLCSAQV